MPLPGTGIILENPAAAPIPVAVAWGKTNIGLSTFAGTSPFYDQPPYATAVDVPDCYFNIPNLQSIAATTGVYIIPPGMGYITSAGATLLQLQVGVLATWVTIRTMVANTSDFYVSDGVNVRVANTTGGALVVTFYPIRA